MAERAARRPSKEQRAQQEQQTKQTILLRTMLLAVFFGVLTFLLLGWKLWDVAIVHHEEYRDYQLRQSTRDITVRANRGAILDANGNKLALSATVYNVVLSPAGIENHFNDARYEKKDGSIDREKQEQEKTQTRESVLRILNEMLGLEREALEKRLSKTTSWHEVVYYGLENEQYKQLKQIISENKLTMALELEPDSKRYYPYNGVAAHIVGFVNSKGGAYGVEAAYQSVLEGTPGRIIYSRANGGAQIHNGYSDYIQAQDGSNITLTIDANIQRMAEQTLAAGIEKYDVRNGGICIVMQPKTGAVLAMANSPTYDLNNFGTVQDPILNEKAAADKQTKYQQLKEQGARNDKGELLSDEQLWKEAGNAAVRDALSQQWRSKVLNDTYEPGSTFKSVVLAAALEAGVISDRDTFYCPGYYVVSGRTIHCSERRGHGSQTLAEAVQNSCNPAFMMIGQKLGADKFYDYLEAFGVKDPTGIDLPGEGKGLLWSRDYFTSAEGYQSLATASFGQRFTVSPLQLLTAFSATINGGYLMQPYVLQSVTDQTGAVLEQSEPVVVRQVVSEQTSQRVAQILESVVSEGTGRNAYVAGYRIGGKTGTAETEVADEEIVSFVGFAPADDPEVIVLLYFDTPRHASPGSKYGSTGYYISGGQMVAPLAGQLIADVLDYMGVERQYTKEEANAADVAVPKVEGYNLATAEKALKKKNLTYRTVGKGDVVTGQIPAVGAVIPGNSTVILYMGEQAPTDQVAVPDLRGLTFDQAKERLNAKGLYMRASGVSYFSAVTKAQDQSGGPGELVDRGTVISVRFIDTSVNDSYTPLE
ncbi:MAG: PASTA domain-containing protein [Oscillospiraceae bacterium]|nr:PASTA domain-containing protein [Oscillospiraceae bacterium]